MALAPDSRLEDILALAGSRYPVAFETVSLGAMDIDLLQIVDLPDYIDRLVETSRPGEKIALPFWAKLWPASLPLSMLVSRLSPAPGKRLLELGAGLGLCGLAAAKRGYQAFITDIDPESLLFIRASILKNGLEHLACAGYLDIATTTLDERFETIVASEALYLPDLHEPLARFLAGHLSPVPDAQAFLSFDQGREAKSFFARVNRDFLLQRSQSTCRSDAGESQISVICRMRRRADA
jgi:predicted nicotinamide N-methyase